MKTKRLFIGTFIDKKIISNHYDEIKKTFSNNCHGKWVEEENLHFTYCFLGDFEISKIEKLKDDLKHYFQKYDLELNFNGISVIPNIKKARILYIKAIDPNEILKKIYYGINRIIIGYGNEKEKNPFKPHVTLIRIKEVRNPDFTNSLRKYENYDFGRMDSFSVNLIESVLTSSGPIYKII